MLLTIAFAIASAERSFSEVILITNF